MSAKRRDKNNMNKIAGKNLIKSTSVVGSMTLLSRISGLVRDVIFANILGDKAVADVFIVAFRIPNFFRRIFGEGAFSSAFVPVFTEYRARHSQADVNDFQQLMTGRLGLILLGVSILGVVFAPLLVSLLSPGFHNEPHKYELAVQATRITFPYIFFISLVAMAGGMLNTCGRFAVPASTPVLLNLSLIFAALVLVPNMQNAPVALAVGVLIAGVIQLLFQLPWLKKEDLIIRPRVVSHKTKMGQAGALGTVRVFRLMYPALLGASVAQVNLIVNTVLASFLVTGSISWLYYSDRLLEFPVGVFGIALGTAILPHLSYQHVSGNAMRQGRVPWGTETAAVVFSRTLDWAARWVVLVCIPCTAGLIVLAQPMVATIFYHGDFTANGVNMTAHSLQAYSIGLTGMVMVKILAVGFFARQNTKTPVRVGVYAMILNVVVGLLLIMPLKHVGLALAMSISSIFNAVALFWLLRGEGVYRVPQGWCAFMIRVIFSTGVMVFLLFQLNQPEHFWLEESAWQRALHLALMVCSGGVIYLVALMLAGLKPSSFLHTPGG